MTLTLHSHYFHSFLCPYYYSFIPCHSLLPGVASSPYKISDYYHFYTPKMRSSLQPKTLLAFLSLVGNGLAAYEGHYFVLRNGDPLVSERLDPIVSPGQNPASHVHNIFGSSSFSETFDFNAAQNAKCNTNGVKADMSNYWYPALYFHDKSNDSYTMVPTQLITYYKYDPINGKPRTAFPPGLKIMAGKGSRAHCQMNQRTNIECQETPC